jgi:phosphoribosylamine--glycine ligase
MNILIIGNGGREHALAWKIRQSPLANKVFVASGNAGTALEPGVENIDISPSNLNGLLDFALKNQIGLTIPGAETALAMGIVDLFNEHNLPCFGPTKEAAKLESSKAFSKSFMRAANIPTADYQSFTDLNAAEAYIKQSRFPLVIKADGLAAGKGVVIAQNEAEALATAKDMLSGHLLGEAGSEIVIETFIIGEEASFIVMADGEHVLALATSQDHKARDNDDQGPNTGGMGAYSPAPVLTSALQQTALKTVIYPTLKKLAADGTPFIGFLYAGLMISPNGELNVLEFNCRLGDPETQPILMRLKSDLIPACLAAMDKRLDTITLEWDDRPALGVVMASKGYPSSYQQGKVIQGLLGIEPLDTKVFHAGTKLDGIEIKTAGGRVLCVTALGDTLKDAQNKAYEIIKHIYWQDEYYRTDIGNRAC